MKRVINKKSYDTDTAQVIATNDFSDGTNKYNCGRTATLYRTKKGNYFSYHETCWQGEHDSITPLSIDEAIEQWEKMYDQRVEFKEAFPDEKIEEA